MTEKKSDIPSHQWRTWATSKQRWSRGAERSSKGRLVGERCCRQRRRRKWRQGWRGHRRCWHRRQRRQRGRRRGLSKQRPGRQGWRHHLQLAWRRPYQSPDPRTRIWGWRWTPPALPLVCLGGSPPASPPRWFCWSAFLLCCVHSPVISPSVIFLVSTSVQSSKSETTLFIMDGGGAESPCWMVKLPGLTGYSVANVCGRVIRGSWPACHIFWVSLQRYGFYEACKILLVSIIGT